MNDLHTKICVIFSMKCSIFVCGSFQIFNMGSDKKFNKLCLFSCFCFYKFILV